MTERSRALLINALAFPGMGQILVLRRRRMGILLVVLSLVAVAGCGWALAMRFLELLPGRLDEVVAGAPWEILGAARGVLAEPGTGLILWGLVLLLGWLLALLDAALCHLSSDCKAT